MHVRQVILLKFHTPPPNFSGYQCHRNLYKMYIIISRSSIDVCMQISSSLQILRKPTYIFFLNISVLILYFQAVVRFSTSKLFTKSRQMSKFSYLRLFLSFSRNNCRLRYGDRTTDLKRRSTLTIRPLRHSSLKLQLFFLQIFLT